MCPFTYAHKRKSFSRDFLLLAPRLFCCCRSPKATRWPLAQAETLTCFARKTKTTQRKSEGKWMDRELSSEANLHQFSILILSNQKVKEWNLGVQSYLPWDFVEFVDIYPLALGLWFWWQYLCIHHHWRSL